MGKEAKKEFSPRERVRSSPLCSSTITESLQLLTNGIGNAATGMRGDDNTSKRAPSETSYASFSGVSKPPPKRKPRLSNKLEPLHSVPVLTITPSAKASPTSKKAADSGAKVLEENSSSSAEASGQ